jgi:tagatose-6-phosphate ketose/aldose isomerase
MEDQINLKQTYLSRFHNEQNKLADMICNPKPGAGLVHTPSEIAQQPQLWRWTSEYMAEQAGKLRSFLKKSGLFNDKHRPTVVFTGAGTSDFVGQSLADLYRVVFNTCAINWPTTRITANPCDFFNGDQDFVFIHFARSGNSPESRAVLEMALSKHPDNIFHIVITCNQEGDLAKISLNNPEKVYLLSLHPDSNDKGLAMTSSFSSMIVAGQAIAHLHAISSFVKIINNLALSAEYFLDTSANEIHDLANPRIERAFFLGNKDLFGAATESALKVQELTAGQLLAKSDDTLGFRHGPISAVDSGSMVCFFLSEDPLTRKYEFDVIKQYNKAFCEMGAKTVVVGANNHQLFNGLDITFLSYDPEDKWRIPVYHQVNMAVLFGQLFGMFQASRRGINVDDPSTEKATYNRVVQGVQIYNDES